MCGSRAAPLLLLQLLLRDVLGLLLLLQLLLQRRHGRHWLRRRVLRGALQQALYVRTRQYGVLGRRVGGNEALLQLRGGEPVGDGGRRWEQVVGGAADGGSRWGQLIGAGNGGAGNGSRR